MSADLRAFIIALATLAAEAGVSPNEMATITVAEFSVRLLLAMRLRAEALAIVVPEARMQ